MPSTVKQQVSKRNFSIPPYDPDQTPYASEELIALFMLERAAEHTKTCLTPLEINKLVYVSHGWILGAYGRPLIDNTTAQIQAWREGPIVVGLHNLLASFDTSPLHLYDFYSFLIKQKNSHYANLLPDPGQVRSSELISFENQNKEVVKGLNWVYHVYTQYDERQLITLTTQRNSLWELNFHPNVWQLWGWADFQRHIPDRVIWEHYRKKIRQ